MNVLLVFILEQRPYIFIGLSAALASSLVWLLIFGIFNHKQGMDTLIALMEHPLLMSVSNSFNSMQEKKISLSENSTPVKSKTSNWIYLFQREFATVDPELVDVCYSYLDFEV